jgi:hypothetical protein
VDGAITDEGTPTALALLDSRFSRNRPQRRVLTSAMEMDHAERGQGGSGDDTHD